MKYNMPIHMNGKRFKSARTQYSLRSRAERLIAAGRVVLSIFFILAIRIDPSEPLRYADTILTILLWYLVCTIILASALWNWDILWATLQNNYPCF